ncbi:Aquaporin [Armadillidium nasatum]|uniref:Aquaporin n=1 Tax=Armadillidium nasatum TaxID=96803 RepID=A0A5N5T5G1_9CRUS|nr:Aquaporin [Armadillidium nasatum]
MSYLSNLRIILGFDEFSRDPPMWRGVCAEFLGTLFFVLIGSFSCLGGWIPGYEPTVVQTAFAFGITIATVIQCTSHVSGGHINPAITIAFLVGRQISVLRAILYIMAQCVGAIAGAAILAGLVPKELRGNLGLTKPSDYITTGQCFGVEVMSTFLLVWTTFSVTDEGRTDLKGSAPLAVGLSAVALGLGAGPISGGSLNPARSFGPAVITGDWDLHWIYWVGPIGGGILASLCYTFCFRAPKNHHCKYGKENYEEE